jgi:hypothetical protein
MAITRTKRPHRGRCLHTVSSSNGRYCGCRAVWLVSRFDLGSIRRAEDSWARIEGSGDGEIMADVDNSASERDAIVPVVFLQGNNVLSDLVDVDVIAFSSVGLSKRIHDGGLRKKAERNFVRALRHEEADG